MKLMKNAEFRRELFLYIISAATATIPAFIFSIPAGICTLSLGAAVILIHITAAIIRYRDIEDLSFSIDRILHGQDDILITKNTEGEISILRSEVEKMTLRLRESTDILRADKLRLTEAIADISHQLRTPLTTMNLTVSLLAAENISSEKRISLTRELYKSLRRIDWLVETLLKISKIDAGTVRFESSKVSVSELIQKSVEPLIIPMELRSQTLKISASDESFNGDLAWSIEAVGNIVKNCTEHTPDGGFVEIISSETPLYTEIVIHDSGNGFDQSDISHLFERFYKGKNASSESIGIGLALARMVIASQNGTIRAENDPEGGARFTIRFYKEIV